MTRMSRHPSDAALTQAAGGDWLNLAACRSQRDRKIGTLQADLDLAHATIAAAPALAQSESWEPWHDDMRTLIHTLAETLAETH